MKYNALYTIPFDRPGVMTLKGSLKGRVDGMTCLPHRSCRIMMNVMGIAPNPRF